ncbi:YciI family protein [Acidiferrobacter sp.]|uniref:YciI family protein n=1 Tax=Acidiferrobacter sp. TaxID=1872107 RepID=UPI002634C1AB|nr:YciI family protein [Acidiferrobacter sp.]
MFVILLHYVKPLAEVDKYLQEHRKFLDKHYAAGHFLASGAQVPRIGGVILAKSVSREELDVVLNEDPFYREDLATYQVIEFSPAKYAVGAEEWFS